MHASRKRLVAPLTRRSSVTLPAPTRPSVSNPSRISFSANFVTPPPLDPAASSPPCLLFVSPRRHLLSPLFLPPFADDTEMFAAERERERNLTRHGCLPGEPARLSLLQRCRRSVFNRHSQIHCQCPISGTDGLLPVQKVMGQKGRLQQHMHPQNRVETCTKLQKLA